LTVGAAGGADVDVVDVDVVDDDVVGGTVDVEVVAVDASVAPALDSTTALASGSSPDPR
jgi:hypothetical protein